MSYKLMLRHSINPFCGELKVTSSNDFPPQKPFPIKIDLQKPEKKVIAIDLTNNKLIRHRKDKAKNMIIMIRKTH